MSVVGDRSFGYCRICHARHDVADAERGSACTIVRRVSICQTWMVFGLGLEKHDPIIVGPKYGTRTGRDLLAFYFDLSTPVGRASDVVFPALAFRLDGLRLPAIQADLRPDGRWAGRAMPKDRHVVGGTLLLPPHPLGLVPVS